MGFGAAAVLAHGLDKARKCQAVRPGVSVLYDSWGVRGEWLHSTRLSLADSSQEATPAKDEETKTGYRAPSRIAAVGSAIRPGTADVFLSVFC
jgi:hypothetical protein